MTPELEIKAHETKKHYPSKAIAKKVLKQLMSMPRYKKGKQRAIYKCRLCGKWQITSREKGTQY